MTVELVHRCIQQLHLLVELLKHNFRTHKISPPFNLDDGFDLDDCFETASCRQTKHSFEIFRSILEIKNRDSNVKIALLISNFLSEDMF